MRWSATIDSSSQTEAVHWLGRANFIAIAYRRLGKLTHLPASPFVPTMALSVGITPHRV